MLVMDLFMFVNFIGIWVHQGQLMVGFSSFSYQKLEPKKNMEL